MLTGVELQALNSFSVADAIRYFSGVQIKDYGGIGGLKTVDIRSMGTNHTGVFYDGIQLVNAQNGQVDLGKFSLDNIEEISLYQGQKSELLQPARDYGTAGSIYIRSRRPRFEGEKKNNIKVAFKTGSFDLINPSFLWEQKITENIASSLSAEFLYSSGKYKFRYRKKLQDGTIAWDTTAVRQNGDIEGFRIEGGFNGYIEQGKWNIKGYYYNSERGIPGAIVNNVWKFSQRQWDRNFFTQGSFQKKISKRYEILVNAKYGHDYLRYQNPDTTLMLIDNEYIQQEIYASVANKFSILKQWEVALSADYQWQTLDANLRDFVNPERHTTLIALATTLDFNRLRAQASLLGTFVNDKVTRVQHGSGELLPGTETGTPDDKQEFTPAAFLSYKPFHNHGLLFNAFYKYIFRMPTFNDLYYTEVGNIALRPEYTTQYNVGTQYTHNFSNGIIHEAGIKADAYYIEVKDKIVCVLKGSSLFRGSTYNIGYVEIRGIDVSGHLNWNLPYDIHVGTSANYTYQKAQDFSDRAEITYDGQIAYIPWHSGSFLLKANYGTWNMNYSFIYVGERYHNAANIPANHEQPWYTHDLSLGKTLQYKKIKFRISAEVNNLLNQYYDVVYNYPMPGRNYKVILKMNR